MIQRQSEPDTENAAAPPSTASTTVGLILLLAVAYIAAGWFGLRLAVPPGYATVIWPASGIAVAGLLFYGLRLWPGVFLGSVALNAYVGSAITESGVDLMALAVAAAIAAGSTLQSLIASFSVRQLFGVPIAMNRRSQVVAFAALVGPVSCVVAPSVGVGALLASGILTAEQAPGNWLTWWTGDLIGVLVFLPIAMFGPWRPWSIKWSGRPMAGLTSASLVVLLIPLGLTFYAWKWTSEITFERNQTAFAALAEDSQQALGHRLDSYRQALDGAAGLIEASNRVSLAEWRTYVDALDIRSTLPGINGIGFISAVDPDKIPDFLASAAIDGVTSLRIHPDSPAPALFVIRYIEPLEQNVEAVGLNIAFEENRYAAATHARDTGHATITKRIFLVQDATKSAGFLLLRPLYRNGVPLENADQRRAAFLGWVYAPFVANLVMDNLTASQGSSINIEIFDGQASDEDQLIYASAGAVVDTHSGYQVTKTLPVLEQAWTLVWKSTPAFDASVRTREGWLVLFGGILLSMLLGIYLLSFARREESIRHMVDLKTREIAAREEQNRSIVDTAVAGILLLDEDGRLLSANAAAESMFGITAADVIGRPARDLLVFDGEGNGPANLLDLLSVRGKGQYESRAAIPARKGDGSRLYLDLQVNSWKTEDGALRYTAVVRDISLQRRMTLALEEAEQRWNTALKGANIGVFDIDLTTGLSIVSDTWRSMLGFAPDADIDAQAEWRSRIHPDDLPAVQAADQACFDGRSERSEVEYRIRHVDGRWIWLRSDASVTERGPDGSAKRFVGTQTDISDLKIAEAELNASRERLRSAIENAPIGMALLDPEGRWLKVNEALCNFLGYSEAELLELDFQTITHPDDLEADLELVQQLVDGKIATYQLEKRYIHKHGQAVWGLLSVSVARDTDGSLAYFISQIQDIGDRKEMDRLKSEFISNVSHELRTPLTSIRGSLGLITGAMSNGIPDGVMRLLKIAHKNSERLVLLVNDILDLEKLTADKLHFDLDERDVVDEVRQAIESNQAYADQFDVTFSLKAPDAPLLVEIDAIRFQQVLSNLMSNAAKFSRQGGEVLIEVSSDKGTARVAVTDRGVGIPPKFRSQIFTPFSQADASATREKGGTGLGLHISKQLVERMRGSIDYATEEGEGTTFWVELPLIRHQSGTGKHSDPGNAGRPDLPSALHVEDDEDFSAFVAAALKDKIGVTNAHSLHEAVEQIERYEHDVIILDLQLPDGNGLDLLDRIPAGSRKPVIVLTATEFVDTDPRINRVIVKSRTPEHEIVEIILAMVEQAGEGAEPGRARR